MAFQTSLIYPVKKFNEELTKQSFRSPKISAKRALFGKVASTSPKKSKYDENSNGKIKKSQNVSPSVKQVFHTGHPSRIIGRTKEIAEIEHFLSDHINRRSAGSLYISGAPGTGKTSCLMTVFKKWERDVSFAFVNCMSVNNPSSIYAAIAQEFELHPPSKNIVKFLEKYFLTSTSMSILVLDEIDHLGQDVLYSLFEWPKMPKSSLILIGVANALDLIDRLLPRLCMFRCEPILMHFHPYSREQITEILQDRLADVEGTVVKPMALQLCARKISACTGDIRKALDVCRRAVEKVQNKRTLQSASADDRCNPGSPMKSAPSIDLPDIASVLNEVYGSRLQSENSEIVTMPLQQRVVLCTLALMQSHCKKSKDVTLGKLYDVYKSVCKKRDIGSVTEWEFNGLCKLIETRSLILLKPAKVSRQTKVVLKFDVSEAEFLLQDKTLLQSILLDKSVLSKC